MATFATDDMDGFLIDMEELYAMPEDIVKEMARAGGEVMKEKIRKKGQSMGVHRTGVTLNSIYSKKPSKTSDGASVTITFKGKNKDGNENAEVAFVNNYGKTGQAARPFVTEGTVEAENESADAAEKVFDEYLDSKNL